MYFNEIDKFCIGRLRKHWHGATVDERDIRDISEPPTDERCHFFGGIGGWELACELAGWRGPIWTGSCPCPPFSSAGKKFCKCGRRFGFWGVDSFGCEACQTNDPRHLWPEKGPKSEKARAASAGGCSPTPNTPSGGPNTKSTTKHRGGMDLEGAAGGLEHAMLTRPSTERSVQARNSSGSGPWSDYRIVYCRDPKGGPPIARRASAELEAFPLADGTPGRVARLKAIGNAIVPQLAAVVLRAWMEAE